MIAFTILGWPVYRYGIFYGVTFLLGYGILGRAGRRSWMAQYPQVRDVLNHRRDDLFLRCMIGVIVGGRLGHVVLYDWAYYSQHLSEVIMVNQWGMSFVGGVVGVTSVLAVLIYRRKLSFQSMKLLGDIVLCIVPIGILLGRIGNGLNQELRGKPVSELTTRGAEIITSLGLTRIYPLVDDLLRVNTNTIQALTEWLLTGLIVWALLILVYPRRQVAGLISGVFLIVYGLVRYRVENLKDLPAIEYRWPLSISQWVMIGFVVVGGWVIADTKSQL